MSPQKKNKNNGKKTPSAAPGGFSMPGMDLGQLEGLLEFMAAHGLEEFEYEHGGLHIRLRKAPAGGSTQVPFMIPMPSAPSAGYVPQAAGSAPAAGEATEAPAAAEELHIIKSPIVGTFYSSPTPGASPFVKVGDSVSAAQVVCIVEAMKLMNEIESDVSGEVVRVLVEDGHPVEYGQGLFAVRPAKKK